MTSFTFQDNQDDCCFSSYFRSNLRTKNQKIEENTLSQQIALKKASIALKNQQKHQTDLRQYHKQATNDPREGKNDAFLKQTASRTKNGEMSVTRKLVNVKLNYSIDNDQVASENGQIAIGEVESQIYRKSQLNDPNSNLVVSESEILHNYFDSSEYIKAVHGNQSQIKAEQPKKIKRLFKTQKQ